MLLCLEPGADMVTQAKLPPIEPVMAVCPNCHEQNPEVGAACPRCDGFYYVPEEALDDAKSDPMVGRMTAGKYVILSLISEGGMGAVYRALQLPVEREVAFKVLRTELKDSDNGRDRFIREARAVSRLNHPNIITLYDFGFDDGRHPYMVMEYAPGKSLAKWLKTEAVTIERIMRVTAQILNALTEAHSRGIVHRDLKPENMIISPKGNDQDYVKLLDFGIARMINEGATRGLTREGEVFGTPHYMAPEQAQGKKELGPPADVYAVGIMMWQMICGECPFDAPTPLAVLFMHINDDLPALRPRDGVHPSPEVELVIRRACAKDPVDRYQTASEMLADIYAIAGFNTSALPGLVGTDPSHEFSLSAATLQPSSHIQSAVVANRQPHFTPSPSSFGSGVHVNDPDPSHVAAFELPAEDEGPPPNNKKLGIIALAGLVLVAVMLAAAVAVLNSEPSEATSLDPQPQTPTETETEVAVKNEPAGEIQVEPIEMPTKPDEAEEPKEEPAEVEVKDEPQPTEEPPKEVAEKKPEPKRSVQEKPKERKPAQKTAQKKEEEKKTTSSQTETTKKTSKPAPGKWTVKPKRWDN